MSVLNVFKTFYGFVLKKKGLFVLFVLLASIQSIAFSISPYFYKRFVEEIPSLNFEFLLQLLLIFAGVRVLGILSELVAFVIGDSILFTAARDARLKIFRHVGELDFTFHTNKSTGSLISAFKRGDGAFFAFFHDIHHRVAGVIIRFLVMVYFLISLNTTIVTLIIASMIATVLAARYLVAYNVKKRKAFNYEEDSVSGVITDNLINFETVKLFAKEVWENKRLKKRFEPWMKTLWGYANSFRLIDVTMGTIIAVSLFSILYISIKQAVSQEMSIADFVLVTSFLGGFYPQLWNLIFSTRDLAKNYADIQKYFSLLEYKEEVLDPENPEKSKNVKGLVEFKKVTHSYKGGTKNAVYNFDLTIKPGESIAFVGRSGSGKTTITKLLMRFFDPEKGAISIDGVDIKKLKKDNLRSFFGVVPQEPVLFNNTIEFNIGYGAKNPTLKEVENAAKLANIDKFIETLPKKYKTNVGERGIKLSGGQKQRLAIARMILSKPEIIIFDEATSHLDSESEKLIQDAFWKVAKEKTTLVVAHRLSTVKKADRIIVMEKGKIIQEGTHKDLLNKTTGVYKKLWDLQLEK